MHASFIPLTMVLSQTMWLVALLVLITGSGQHECSAKVHTHVVEASVGTNIKLTCAIPVVCSNTTTSDDSNTTTSDDNNTTISDDNNTCLSDYTFQWKRIAGCQESIVRKLNGTRFKQTREIISFIVKEHDFSGFWACEIFKTGDEKPTLRSVQSLNNNDNNTKHGILTCGNVTCNTSSEMCTKEHIELNNKITLEERCRHITKVPDELLKRMNGDPRQMCLARSGNWTTCTNTPTTTSGQAKCCYCVSDNCNRRDINTTATPLSWDDESLEMTSPNEVPEQCRELTAIAQYGKAKVVTGSSDLATPIVMLVLFSLIVLSALLFLVSLVVKHRRRVVKQKSRIETTTQTSIQQEQDSQPTTPTPYVTIGLDQIVETHTLPSMSANDPVRYENTAMVDPAVDEGPSTQNRTTQETPVEIVSTHGVADMSTNDPNEFENYAVVDCNAARQSAVPKMQEHTPTEDGTAHMSTNDPNEFENYAVVDFKSSPAAAPKTQEHVPTEVISAHKISPKSTNDPDDFQNYAAADGAHSAPTANQNKTPDDTKGEKWVKFETTEEPTEDAPQYASIKKSNTHQADPQ